VRTPEPALVPDRPRARTRRCGGAALLGLPGPARAHVRGDLPEHARALRPVSRARSSGRNVDAVWRTGVGRVPATAAGAPGARARAHARPRVPSAAGPGRRPVHGVAPS